MTAPAGHPSTEALLAYWLHETDRATTDTIDEHLLHCDACGATFDALVAIGQGVRATFRSGAVATVMPGAFVARLHAEGVRIREYRVAQNGSVNCSVAPDDDLLVARLAAPLAGVARLDVVATVSYAPAAEFRLDDIPFDAASGEVVWVPKLADIRAQPRHDATLTLVARDGDAERAIGRYVFHHRPWPPP